MTGKQKFEAWREAQANPAKIKRWNLLPMHVKDDWDELAKAEADADAKPVKAVKKKATRKKAKK